MLNHTYTSVKNANLVDCGKKQHIASQPSPLLRDNYLGEFRTELDKKKVLANLGIATELSLEWGNIGGSVGDSASLINELNERETQLKRLIKSSTTFESLLDQSEKAVTEVVQALELQLGREQEEEDTQNQYIEQLLADTTSLLNEIKNLRDKLYPEIKESVDELDQRINNIDQQLTNITSLITVSNKPSNALSLITAEKATHIWDDSLNEGEGGYREALEEETATHLFDSYINSGEGGYREPISDDFLGLYVPDLSEEVTTATDNIVKLQEDVSTIIENYVTKEELGGDGDFNFVKKQDFTSYVNSTSTTLGNIQTELVDTIKKGEDGHVKDLSVHQLSKYTDEDNIKITDSFEVTSGIPLDVRFVVKSIGELHSLNPLVCYAGMGVIVSDQASLYILREPANGIIDEDYILDKDGLNWKCPEDLIIEVLTQEEYDQKEKDGSINPNMFYYIHEEVTEEPLRKDFASDAEYAEALDKWLRVLQQKYMSAVWGQEIEKLVSDKATQGQIKSLEEEIQRVDTLVKSLSGGSSDINLRDLNDQVQQNVATLTALTAEKGTIPTIQQDISDLQNTIEKDYVTKEDITIEDPELEYIFVKKSAFDTYKTQHEADIATKVTTETLSAKQINLDESVLATSDSNLVFNSEVVALDKNIPNIEMIDNNIFKDLTDEEKDSDVYYYVYDLEERYVLDSDYSKYKEQQASTISNLSGDVSTNASSIGTLENLTTENKNSLVYSINELHNYISRISSDLDTLITGEGIISSMQASIEALSKDISEKYVTIKSITIEDPDTSYIFIKNSEFETYKNTQAEAQAESISTNQVNTNSIKLQDNVLTSEESSLLFNEKAIALEENVPNIVVIDSKSFDPEKAESDVYYYITEEDTRYVLSSELQEYQKNQTQVKLDLQDIIQTNKSQVGDIKTLATDNKDSIVLAINELVSKIALLSTEVEALKALHSSQEPA